MTIIQKAFIATALIAAVGTAFYETNRASQLQQQAQALLLKQDSLVKQLQQELEESANKLAAAQKPGVQPHSDSAEIIKLRADVAKLRGAARALAQLKADAASKNNDPTELAMRSWVDRVTTLKDKFEQMPGQKIPELQFLSDVDWLNAVKNIGPLDTEAGVAKALSALRTAAKDAFAPIVQTALQSYAQANNGQAPTDISQLQPYFTSLTDDSVLQRYAINQSGAVIELATPLDDQDDKYYQITANTINSSSREEDALQPAVEAYSAANSGQMPNDPSQLLPYVTTPAEQAAIQSLLQNHTGR